MCPIINILANNEFSRWLYARSCLMFCDVTVRDRRIAVAVKAIHTASAHNILPDSSLSDV